MRIITVATEKGGVAKTTSAVHIAHGLAKLDSQVLLVDFDSQGNCSLHLGLDPAPGIFEFYCQSRPLQAVIVPSGRPGLHLLPGNSYTKAAAREADRQAIPLDLLLTELHYTPTTYDYIVIDTHPGGYFQEVALWMADLLIIPAALDALSMDAVRSTIDTAQEIAGREGKAPPPIQILPQFYRHTNEAKYNHGLLEEHYCDVLCSPIPDRVAAREAVSYGKTLYEHAPTNDATHAYQQLVARLAMTDVEILFGEVSG